jgi:hypothetical protein
LNLNLNFGLNLIGKTNLAHLAIWHIWPAGPTGLLAQPAHLVRLNQPARVWVGQTDPAQPSLASPLPLELAGDLDRRRRHLATPAISGDPRRRYLDRMVASTSSTNSSSWNPRKLPL